MVGETSVLDLVNCSLVQDELLWSISAVLDDGARAGPSFVYALGGIVEAAVLSEQVFFDPLRNTLGPSLPGTMSDRLRDSDFVRVLSREGVLQPLPESEAIDTHLEASDSDYRMVNYIDRYAWGPHGWATVIPDRPSDLTNVRDILREAPRAFALKVLIPLDDDEPYDPAVVRLAELGFTTDDVLWLEAAKQKALGYRELAHALGLALHSDLLGLPYSLGALELTNNRAGELVAEIEATAVIDGQPVGSTALKRLPIPPLAQLVLARSKGYAPAIVDEILALRMQHTAFRDWLTNHERSWREAKTNDEFRRLTKQWKGAWDTLLTKENAPSTRLVYRVWDFVRDSLGIAGPLKPIGDHIATAGRERAAIYSVRGLTDFWHELGNAPTLERNHELVRGLNLPMCDDSIWRLGSELAGALAASCDIRGTRTTRR